MESAAQHACLQVDVAVALDVGNSRLKRPLQKGKTLMITTERGPADEVELQRQIASQHKDSMARDDLFYGTKWCVPFNDVT
jgi:hypothetical protein